MPKHTLAKSDNVVFFGYWQRLTLALLVVTVAALLFADTEIIALEPLNELKRMLAGLVSADFFATEYLLEAMWQTVSFALLGISLGLLLGFPLSLIYNKPFVAPICAFVRAIHEIFWALLFLQLFGLNPITGILALGLPYGATFARVFYDILSQVPNNAMDTFPASTSRLSRYLYGKLAAAWPQISAYIRYRFECALRSSAVLGFIGLPTLGFYLETAFRQGLYSQGFALLILFIILIGTISLWCKIKLIPAYLIAAMVFLPESYSIDGQLLWQFLTQDILPPVLQHASLSQWADASVMTELSRWLSELLIEQAWPGLIATLVLALSAVGVTHGLVFCIVPLASKHTIGRQVTWLSGGFLLIIRSVPEYIIAFVAMLLLGPSMLPAILALAIHNAGLISYLVTRQSNNLALTATYRGGKLDDYAYHLLPRLYPNMMALLFYRFEVILRETAIFGVLGVATLGFYIDSQFAEIRFSGALVLITITALLNVLVDAMSRSLLARNTGMKLAC